MLISGVGLVILPIMFQVGNGDILSGMTISAQWMTAQDWPAVIDEVFRGLSIAVMLVLLATGILLIVSSLLPNYPPKENERNQMESEDK